MNADITIANPATWSARPVTAPEHAPAALRKSEQALQELPGLPKTGAKADTRDQSRRLDEALTRLNEMMKNSKRNLAFSRDEAINATVITVKDTVSGEVVRQIPNEAVLRVAHSIDELKGMLHNEKI